MEMKYQIDKQFDFCYGHRVHNQQLHETLSDGQCKCRHLHGHNGKLKIGLEANHLVRGMVTDFKNLEAIKRLVDDVLDHKFIIDISDPLFDELFNNTSRYVQWDKYGIGSIPLWAINEIAANIKDKDLAEATVEKLEGLVIVNFVPTSENLCHMFAEVANKVLEPLFGGNVKVSYVDFWETPKSHCRATVLGNPGVFHVDEE